MVVSWVLLTSAIIMGPLIVIGLSVAAGFWSWIAVSVLFYTLWRTARRLVLATRPAWPLAYTAVPTWGLVSLVLALVGGGFGWTESAFLCLFATFVGFMVWATRRRAAGGRVISA